jgi:hypothetical protein
VKINKQIQQLQVQQDGGYKMEMVKYNYISPNNILPVFSRNYTSTTSTLDKRERNTYCEIYHDARELKDHSTRD